MAVKIEKGGKILIFLMGLGLIYVGLSKYGYLDSLLGKSSGSSGSGSGSGSGSASNVDTTQPLAESKGSNNARVRVNIWVGCVAGLVANGGLDTVPGSIYADKGMKVSFKIIDDWTEGA